MEKVDACVTGTYTFEGLWLNFALGGGFANTLLIAYLRALQVFRLCARLGRHSVKNQQVNAQD